MQPPGTFSFAQALIAFVIHTAVDPLHRIVRARGDEPTEE